MGKTNITLLLGLAIILALLFGYAQYCNPVTTVYQPVNIDSLNAAYEDALMKSQIDKIATERERDEAKKELNEQVKLMQKTNLTLTASNEKVKALIVENKKLKAASDTLGLVTNCNDLVEHYYNLTVAVDSLQVALAESQQLANDLIEMQDQEIDAANDAALKSHEFAMNFKAAADSANYQLTQVPKLRTKEKRKAFYNGGLFGMVAGIIIGVVVTR